MAKKSMLSTALGGMDDEEMEDEPMEDEEAYSDDATMKAAFKRMAKAIREGKDDEAFDAYKACMPE